MSQYSFIPPEEVARACSDSADAAAWEEFVRRFQPVIARIALRTAWKWGKPSGQLVDDLVQETYVKLCADGCRLLRNFQSRHEGAIFGFLKIVTVNVVHDYFRASGTANHLTKDVQYAESTEAQAAAPLTTSSASIEQEVLMDEIDTCIKNSLEPNEVARSRRIFWLYYRCGLTASAISSLPDINLTTKGVESTLFRLRRLVSAALNKSGVDRKETKAAEDQKGLRPAGSF